MAQLVKRPTVAQVMISQFVNLSPPLGSALTAQRLLGIVSLSLSLPTCSLSLSLKINLKKKLKFCSLDFIFIHCRVKITSPSMLWLP